MVGSIAGSPVIVAVGFGVVATWGLAALACGLYGAYEGARKGWQAGPSAWAKPFTAALGALCLAGVLTTYGLAGDYSDVVHYDFGEVPAVIGSMLPKTTTATAAITMQPDAPRRDLPLTATSGSCEPVEAAPPRAPTPTPGILTKLEMIEAVAPVSSH
jgi:hypothetical protein